MDENPETTGTTVPTVHPATADETAKRRVGRWRRSVQVGVALGVAAGVAVGATALASAATSGSGSPSSSPSASPKSTPPHGGHRMFGFGGAGFGGFGGGIGGYGPVLHAVETVKGPNGYETIEIQNGTVTSVKDVSGSTWSLVVTSADKTALTYTVNSGSSVNGGEMGIATVESGDTVSVVATVVRRDRNGEDADRHDEVEGERSQLGSEARKGAAGIILGISSGFFGGYGGRADADCSGGASYLDD